MNADLTSFFDNLMLSFVISSITSSIPNPFGPGRVEELGHNGGEDDKKLEVGDIVRVLVEYSDHRR